jgi:hypothetical protein
MDLPASVLEKIQSNDLRAAVAREAEAPRTVIVELDLPMPELRTVAPGNAGTAFLHHRRSLVPERQRDGTRPVAVDHREVGVTQAGACDPDQNLVRPRGREVDGLDRQGPARRVGPRRGGVAQHGCANSHRHGHPPEWGHPALVAATLAAPARPVNRSGRSSAPAGVATHVAVANAGCAATHSRATPPPATMARRCPQRPCRGRARPSCGHDHPWPRNDPFSFRTCRP